MTRILIELLTFKMGLLISKMMKVLWTGRGEVVLLNRIGHAYRDTLQERLVVRMMVFKEIIDTIFSGIKKKHLKHMIWGYFFHFILTISTPPLPTFISAI